MSHALVLAAGVIVGTLALRCHLGIHSWYWQFVGSSWTPDAYTEVCRRCGRGR